MQKSLSWSNCLAVLTALLMSSNALPAGAEGPVVGRVTLDNNGNVIDATGRIVAFVMSGLAGSKSPSVRITIDPKGRVSDATGKDVGRLIVGASDTFNEIAKVAADADGNLVDRSGVYFAHIVAGGSDGTTPPKPLHIDGTGKLLDPTGTVVGQAAVVPRGGYIDRRGQLEARIAKELKDKRITSTQADRLSNSIEDTARDEQQYTKDGVLTEQEEKTLIGKLDKITERLEQSIRSNRN